MKQIYYAIQNLIRGKESPIIKVVSLSLGLFISIVLFARVALELSYDTFYQDSNQLYIVETTWDKGKSSPYNIYPTGETLMKHFPKEVENSTVIFTFVGKMLQHGEEKYQSQLIATDSLFIPTMGIPLLKGNTMDLTIPNTLFLSQSFARQIFKDESPIGKTLLWGGKQEVTVRGIFMDIPENVSIPTNAILSINSIRNRKDWNSGGNYMTMIRLKEGADANIINQRSKTVFSNYLPINEHYGKHGIKDINISITPLRGYHLQQEQIKTMIYTMSILAIILLFTAAFNYALISISSLSHRAKAIGVHKCVGAETKNIFGMFLWETLLIVVISILLAFFLILNFREKIEELTDATFEGMFSIQNLWAPMIAIIVLFIIGCIIPGRLFSSIPVTQVFQRYTDHKKHWKYPLLFIQFCGTTFFLGLVAIVLNQYYYTVNKDLGWNGERLVHAYHSFENPSNGLSNLRNLPYVEGVENANNLILDGVNPSPVKDANDNILFHPRSNFGDTNFCKLVGLRLIKGRYHTNSNELIVNREFVKKMGWNSNGIGEVVLGMGTVTGIIDFSFPDRAEMEPFCIRWWNNDEETSCIHIRLKEPFEDNLQRLNEDMKKLYPQEDILFRPVNETLYSYFHSERIFCDSAIIACIAILVITLMGIIGYTNDEVRHRSKEIAIRKINGADVKNILQMLCRNIVIIAIPAIIIGSILAWQISDLWLSVNYRDILPVSPLLYIGTGIITLAFIIGTVIWKAWHIANENPVLAIKSE